MARSTREGDEGRDGIAEGRQLERRRRGGSVETFRVVEEPSFPGELIANE